MPYRQLPTTDANRLHALTAAADKAAAVPSNQLAFSAESKTKLDTLYPQFQTEISLRGTALAQQTEATKAQDTQAVRVRMWASHFLQNLNMAIDRGVISTSARAFYLLDVSKSAIPKMSSEADLLLWAGRVVSGEAARIAAGGGPILCPPVAEVAAELTHYQTLHSTQSTKKDAFDNEQKDVDALRGDVDTLIHEIWDEVEFFFRRETTTSMRNKAREYGVHYVSRVGEPTDHGNSLAAPANVALTQGPSNVLIAHWDSVTGADSYQIFKQYVGTDPNFVQAGTSNSTNLTLGYFPVGAVVRAKVRALQGSTTSPDSTVAEITVAMSGP